MTNLDSLKHSRNFLVHPLGSQAQIIHHHRLQRVSSPAVYHSPVALQMSKWVHHNLIYYQYEFLRGSTSLTYLSIITLILLLWIIQTLFLHLKESGLNPCLYGKYLHLDFDAIYLKFILSFLLPCVELVTKISIFSIR